MDRLEDATGDMIDENINWDIDVTKEDVVNNEGDFGNDSDPDYSDSDSEGLEGDV